MASERTAEAAGARICAVLAGGRGRRLGGGKPMRELAGRPLAVYPIEAARRAGLEPVLVVKPVSAGGPAETGVDPGHGQPTHGLDGLDGLGARLIIESSTPFHPLLGIATALDELGEPVVSCPCDVPLLGPRALGYLARQPPAAGPHLLASREGPEPLLGQFAPDAAAALRAAAEDGLPAREAIGNLGPRLHPIEATGVAPACLRNVNTPSELAATERLIAARR